MCNQTNSQLTYFIIIFIKTTLQHCNKEEPTNRDEDEKICVSMDRDASGRMCRPFPEVFSNKYSYGKRAAHESAYISAPCLAHGRVA